MQSTLAESYWKNNAPKDFQWNRWNSEKDEFAAAAAAPATTTKAFVASNKLKIKSNILMFLF